MFNIDAERTKHFLGSLPTAFFSAFSGKFPKLIFVHCPSLA
ncbi:hypothetical protein SIAM614_19781 [Stappia aggregata IAM 12614]|uniref:Uncharacterized protein n=1 Tax=Roseibium aggregatum (strain ATCC 25650 / DSM 13394 / JCM 20685 / NBRC 16684 / NCIMB 2208 / IAM 12614 / B1) TaxID=384765 RepID=A0NVT3_ROSAI|nr:hypothetical protein SIAM614_19781 [Stappia aggregata IAM 12614] [Roseibium aggregatum IAM 12614]